MVKSPDAGTLFGANSLKRCLPLSVMSELLLQLLVLTTTISIWTILTALELVSLALTTSTNGFPSPWAYRSQFHKITHVLHSGSVLCIWPHLLSSSSLFLLALFTSLLFLNMANTVSCKARGTYHLPVTILLPSGLFSAFVICVAHSLIELKSLSKEHMVRVSFPPHSI